jgi:hypothetical protein
LKIIRNRLIAGLLVKKHRRIGILTIKKGTMETFQFLGFGIDAWITIVTVLGVFAILIPEGLSCGRLTD